VVAGPKLVQLKGAKEGKEKKVKGRRVEEDNSPPPAYARVVAPLSVMADLDPRTRSRILQVTH
jgi:hypothetical protein